MALKLKAPREGKSPNYTIRGTYLGVRLDKSAGTPVEATARRVLTKIKREIEKGVFAVPGEKTFLDAAEAYMQHHPDHRFLEKIINHFDETPLSAVDQSAIDAAAVALYPKSNAPTRNRQVYSPISAILKFSNVTFKVRRPKGWRGSGRTDWYTEENAFKIFKAADEIDPEFGLYLRYVCYTGLRLSESLTLEVTQLDLDRGFCYVGKTKNGLPRGIHLPPHLVEAFRKHPRGLDRVGERVFRFRKNKQLYKKINKAKKAAGLEKHPGQFHVFRHTFGTWMTIHAGLDGKGLVETGVWADEASANRYRHAAKTPAAQRSDLLPVEGQKKTA